ncbi:tetratricopeptide repeat protein [Rhodopila sp.]|uniref:tetratricopeptide repeat protein n=1 Tax=Rhodopila sp. TaxID=2480087 RepID=UPI003D12C87D
MATEQLAAAWRLLGSGSWLEAETQARAAVALQPDDPHVRLLLGLAIAAMGEAERAAPVLRQVALQRPDTPHPCQDLAALSPALPRSLIRRQFRACLRLSPDHAPLRLAFAELLLEHDCPAEAEAVLAEASDGARKHHLIGLAQAEQGHFQSAIAGFSRALEHDPAAASWSNLGMMLKIEGRFNQAIAAHDQAVSLVPDNPQYRVNRAVALLQAGRWTAAWQDYEWRLRLAGGASVAPDKLLPSLSELGDLTGLTIIALHEEGFGDTLQFLRYLPLLADRGARVVVHVPPPLARLMSTVPGVAEVVTDASRLPAHDFVCPFFSLPRAFGTTVHSIPPVPRLAPDPALAAAWLPRLPQGGMLVGLVWAGQSRPWLPGFGTLDRRRSAGLAAFEPLAAVPGARFISLQMGPASRQTPPPGMTLFDPMPQVADFAETAAIVAALDVVVSVDTSVVHLAGLLGKRVFLLDRYDGCWRWLSGRSDSPWYPNLTIFRQEQPNDWSAPIARMAASLGAMALFHGASHAGTTERDRLRLTSQKA